MPPTLTKWEYDELHAILCNHVYNAEGVASEQKLKKLRRLLEKLRILAR